MSSRILVRYFGSIRDEAGISEETLEIPDGWDVGRAIEYMVNKHNILASRERHLLFALNKKYTERDAKLNNGDELAIFPMVSGG